MAVIRMVLTTSGVLFGRKKRSRLQGLTTSLGARKGKGITYIRMTESRAQPAEASGRTETPKAWLMIIAASGPKASEQRPVQESTWLASVR